MTGGADAGRVVVGVDGSPGARAALVWAVAHSLARGGRLTVVSLFPVEIYWDDANLIDERRVEVVRSDTEGQIRALIDEVRAEYGGGAAAVDVDVEIIPGPAAHGLLAAAEEADLLVVGSRGRGAVLSTVLGSVALHVATHARCPVVVVRPRAEGASASPRVVVGLDGSDGSREALAFGVVEAERLGADVTAVAAYSVRSYWSGAYEAVVPPVERLREAVRRDAASIVERVGTPATVSVKVLPVEGPPGQTLVRAAEDAALLVVGNRGRGAVRRMVLGSVTLHCVIHAPCPVMVVPARAGAAVG
jgi:nucleotide-binding universal stress UspA family protein